MPECRVCNITKHTWKTKGKDKVAPNICHGKVVLKFVNASEFSKFLQKYDLKCVLFYTVIKLGNKNLIKQMSKNIILLH